MFPYTHVEEGYRRCALVVQLSILGLLVFFILGSVGTIMTTRPPFELSLVPVGDFPFFCICCSDNNTLIGAAANLMPEEEIYVGSSWEEEDDQDGHPCACTNLGAFGVNTTLYAVELAVSCFPSSSKASVAVKLDRQSSIIDLPGRDVIYQGLTTLVLHKKKVGWDYGYRQDIEDRYEIDLGTWLGNSLDMDFAWFDNWRWTVRKVPLESRIVGAWVYLPAASPVMQYLQLGFLNRASKRLGQLGGLISTATLLMGVLFVRKNREHLVNQIYNQRTPVHAVLLQALLGSDRPRASGIELQTMNELGTANAPPHWLPTGTLSSNSLSH